MPVEKIIAALIPWRIRKAIKTVVDGARPHASEAAVYKPVPQPKTRFLPEMSARRPKGRRSTAAGSTKEDTTQVRSTASMENSVAIAGRAIVMEDAMKGVMNEVRVAMSRTTLRSMGAR
jgi:hypothetical protein